MNFKWETYEEVATYLLNQFASDFGLIKVEAKQKVLGKKSGTSWAIDAKGILKHNEGIVIVECRRFIKSKQNQGKIGSLAYSIIDTGAKGGIIVSPYELQSGAQLVAEANNIIAIKLDPNSTPTEFFMKFLNKIFVGIHEQAHASDKCEATLIRTCNRCLALK